jgi:HEAT repeat protein
MARYALEPNPDPSVDEAFRTALNNLKGRPLVGVIVSVGVRKDARAVQALAKFLSDANSDVVQAAARSLGKIANTEATQALQGALPATSGPNQLAVCEGLFRCAESMQATGDDKAAVGIYDALRKADAAHHVKTGALRGAIIARGEGGAAVLREQLLNDDYLLFATAVRTSYEMPQASVTEALAVQLPKLTDDDRKRMVILALGKRSDAAALPALNAAARSGPAPIRIAAIRALAETRNPSAAAGLAELVEADNRQVAQAALESLGSLEGERVDSTVLAMLKSDNTSRRVAAIELIGRRRMANCLPDLLKAARDQNAEVRPAALRQVGELGTASTASQVLEFVPDLKTSDDLDAAEQALSTLCAKGDADDCADQLAARFDQVQPAQKAMLLRVLSSVGTPKALATVRSALKDSNAEVHAAAIRALGSWKTADAAPDLLAIAKNSDSATDRTLSLRGYVGLASNPDIPADQRLAMCREAADLAKSDEQKKLLLSAVSGINSAEAAAMAANYLDDPATKEEAVAGISAIAERMLQGQRGAQAAPRLIEPLEKAAAAATGEESSKRVKTLLQQARSRSNR